MQEKVISVCGKENVQAMVKRLETCRNHSIKEFFISEGADTTRIKIMTNYPAKFPHSEMRLQYLIEFGVE